jgi:nucleoside-diphosphate-sugar epimerase
MSTKGITLVTGSAGRVGRAAVTELVARGHRVRGFDRVITANATESIIGNVQKPGEIQAAMLGVRTLIHLAATPDDDDFEHALVPNNILGLHHVMEAARLAGVRRLILASSGQMNDGQQITGPWPIRATDPITPRYWYAATKAFMESIGCSFAQRHGIEVISARLGWCPRTREQEAEIAAEPRFQDVYFSPGDVGRFFAACVEAKLPHPYVILYGASRPVHQPRFDLETTRALLGYEPRDQWPEGLR